MTSPALVSDFLDWYLAANPVHAALAGAQGYDRTLGDFTETGMLARERESRRWLKRLQAVGGGGFEDEIDRELVMSALRGGLAYEAELVDAAVARLAEVPEFQRPILSVASYLQPPPLSTSRIGHFFV